MTRAVFFATGDVTEMVAPLLRRSTASHFDPFGSAVARSGSVGDHVGSQTRNPVTTSFVALLEYLGTFAFAISGGLVAVRHRLDLFGVLVLAFAAAAAGGVTRDLLLGATPPVALVEWHYLAIATLAGLLTFLRHEAVERMRNPVQFFDAIGLGLFAVLGAGKALALGTGPLGAVMLGVLTGVGGGIVRDMLVAQIPSVLQRGELYAVAALAGATVVVVGHTVSLPAAPAAMIGAAVCFALRWTSICRGWSLPVPGEPSGDILMARGRRTPPSSEPESSREEG